MSADVSIQLDNVTLDFPIQRTGPAFLKEFVTGRFSSQREGERHFRALDGVGFEVNRGEVVGIMGPNGAGKSTMLRVVAGIYPPDGGVVRTRGRVSLLASLGAGFAGDLSGYENAYLNGAVMGLERKHIKVMLPSIVEFAGIGNFMGQPLRTYSSGMRARLAFSIASHLKPEILLIDEVLAVGDAAFKVKSRERILSMVEGDATVVIVSHSEKTIKELCDRAFCLHNGSFITDGSDIDATIEAYREVSSLR